MALDPEKIRHRFEKAVDLVQKTQAGSVAFENNCEQAFGEFRIATLHSKRVPHLLDEVTLKDDVWDFLLKVSETRPPYHQRVDEVVDILLQSKPWMEAFAKNPKLVKSRDRLPEEIRPAFDNRLQDFVELEDVRQYRLLLDDSAESDLLQKAVETFSNQYCGTSISVAKGPDAPYDCVILPSNSYQKAEEHLKQGKDVLLLGRLPESTSQLETLARFSKEYPNSKLVATYPEDAIHSLQPIANIKSLFISFGPTVSKLQSLRILKKVTSNARITKSSVIGDNESKTVGCSLEGGAAVCARWTPSNGDLFCSGDASTDNSVVQIRLVKQDPVSILTKTLAGMCDKEETTEPIDWEAEANLAKSIEKDLPFLV
ncbi:hypothetical protein FOL47_006239 [Perkinsus chesapeaki]|uniref:Uncharacterized protein n=1 Tax=Perkinsus chesapeaki TaxID=330153 RepID=A0A7J6LT35_PERCH|nr:hypothetical protein FOL47_006239 [Perkinsus chesapeaki]